MAIPMGCSNSTRGKESPQTADADSSSDLVKGGRRNDDGVNDKAKKNTAICKRNGHVLVLTSASKLAASALDKQNNRKFQKHWKCDNCAENFRSRDVSGLYHCTQQDCGVDLCGKCYNKLHHINKREHSESQERATTCRDLGHVLTATTAERLIEQEKHHSHEPDKSRCSYQQVWTCTYCQTNYSSADGHPIHHCSHHGCGVDLCERCYCELGIAPTAAVFSINSNSGHLLNSTSSHRRMSGHQSKHSDGKIHPTSKDTDADDIPHSHIHSHSQNGTHHERKVRRKSRDSFDELPVHHSSNDHSNRHEKKHTNSRSSFTNSRSSFSGTSGEDEEKRDRHRRKSSSASAHNNSVAHAARMAILSITADENGVINQ